jgi:flavin reductase (DIM6/NTAB) family NADH-FMN oxidoreductase RutF
MDQLDRHEAFELASPFPYVIAVTLDKRERPNLIGLSWWTFTSWDPLMIAISVGRRRYSHECLEHHKEFALCFPSEEQAKDAWLCGTKSGRDTDKFQLTNFKPLQAINISVPVIDGVTVAYECKIVNQIETGDHTLYIANVASIYGDPEKTNHLYSIHYTKFISIGSKGDINLDLEYR